MRLPFTKMHGAGNDFVVFDGVNRSIVLSAQQIRRLADRRFGIGCDQVLLVEPPISPGADFRYRIFNADGGEVEQCGNGARCFVRFVRDKRLTAKDEIAVETLAGMIYPRLEADGSVDVSSALFNMLNFIPGTPVLTVGVILLIAIFFITSSDSGALVMGMIATGGQVNPKKRIRTFFVLITAILAISLLLSGGLVALQTAAIIIALPFSVVMLLICWSTYIAFSRERRAYEKARRAQLVDHIGDFYGLEVEELAENGILGGTPRWMQMLRRRGAPAGAAVPEEILPSPEPSTAAVDTLMASAPHPRHASQLALQVENAEADGVLIADVDDVVDHDPRASQDVQDVPDRGDATPSRW